MMDRMMGWLDNRDLGLLLIRLSLAAIFIYAGWMKFSNLENAIIGFGQMGLAPFFVYLVATVELLGGVAMLVGRYTRHAGLLLGIVMVFAIVLVKAEMGFAMAQIDVALLASALGIAMIGPGKWTV